MIAIHFTAAVPNTSYYRHQSWEPGRYERFRHAHTMASSLEGFSFWNTPEDQAELERLNGDYPAALSNSTQPPTSKATLPGIEID